MDIERIIDSERYILGTCIDHNENILKVIDVLKEEDFYRSTHKIVYKTITELYKKNIVFDIGIVLNALSEEIKGKLITISEISSIAGCISNHAFKSHIDFIKEVSNQRIINNICKDIINSNSGSEDKINLIQNELLKITTETEEDKIVKMSEVMDKTMHLVEKAYESGSGISGMSTGMSTIDKITNGLQREEFVILGARPSMGKTAFSLKLLQGIKEKVLFVQLDMSLEGMGQRILASNTLMENGKIGRGKLSEEEWELLAEEYNKLAKKDNLFFYKPSRLTPEKLRTKAKQLQIQEGLDVIIVDHIGKLSSTLGDANSYVAMSDISNRLKSLALELKVCVIGLCQLSRAPEQRANHRPMLSDLRESGRLEEDADVIGFLYRDGYYQQRENGEDITEDVLEVDFQKCRNGRIGKAELHYNLATQRLSEMFGR